MNQPPKQFEPRTSYQAGEDERVEKIKTDLTKRLQKACSHLSENDFLKLVEKMARVQLGGERGH
ncbi:MAG TPA: hypothetical protein VD771_06625 [Gemmatimonadaceae bacterium]|nr:hypothetical protein [Gemmatimonadaceae bacterium]